MLLSSFDSFCDSLFNSSLTFFSLSFPLPLSSLPLLLCHHPLCRPPHILIPRLLWGGAVGELIHCTLLKIKDGRTTKVEMKAETECSHQQRRHLTELRVKKQITVRENLLENRLSVQKPSDSGTIFNFRQNQVTWREEESEEKMRCWMWVVVMWKGIYRTSGGQRVRACTWGGLWVHSGASVSK